MADTLCHAALGAAVMSCFSKDKSVKTDLVIYGAVFGAWPDAVPALVSSFGADRWALYNVYHHTWTWMDLIGSIPFVLHKVSDIPFHPVPGWNWWPSLAWLDILYWVIAAGLFFYSYTRRIS